METRFWVQTLWVQNSILGSKLDFVLKLDLNSILNSKLYFEIKLDFEVKTRFGLDFVVENRFCAWNSILMSNSGSNRGLTTKLSFWPQNRVSTSNQSPKYGNGIRTRSHSRTNFGKGNGNGNGSIFKIKYGNGNGYGLISEMEYGNGNGNGLISEMEYGNGNGNG